jgi:hypothetical protein
MRPGSERDAFFDCCTGEQVASAIEHLGAQPLAPFLEPLQDRDGALPGMERPTCCARDRAIPPALQRRMIAKHGVMRVVELDTDDAPFLSTTAELIAALHGFGLADCYFSRRSGSSFLSRRSSALGLWPGASIVRAGNRTTRMNSRDTRAIARPPANCSDHRARYWPISEWWIAAWRRTDRRPERRASPQGARDATPREPAENWAPSRPWCAQVAVWLSR